MFSFISLKEVLNHAHIIILSYFKMSQVPVEVVVLQSCRSCSGTLFQCAPVSAFILEPLQRNLNETKS